MKAFFWKVGRVVNRDTDAVDLVTKKYIIRIRISGISIYRKARPKKGIPQKRVYNEDYDFTGEPT